MNRLVNEQTEIGLLLAVPGLQATLSLAALIIRLYYTDAFLSAASCNNGSCSAVWGG